MKMKTQVLIAGGGPVGLSLAVELGRRNIDCLVVEPRTDIVVNSPRAKTTNARTMEHFRRWGLAQSLREAAFVPVEWYQDVVFCTTLIGSEIVRFKNAYGFSTSKEERFAEPGQHIPQFQVERVLRNAVQRLEKAELALGWKIQSVVQRNGTVISTIVNESGEKQEIESVYLVGCDGARSTVRKEIGAFYEGTSSSTPNFSILFRAPGLNQRISFDRAVTYWSINGQSPGTAGRLDLEDTWWLNVVNVTQEEGERDPLQFIYGFIGEEMPVEIIATDAWVSRMLLANQYRKGNVFLAGDAAHLNPPWGGYGFNTGVGDAVDLGWKLAASLEGWAGERLLDSYEAERRPIHQRIINEAVKNMTTLSNDLYRMSLEIDEKQRMEWLANQIYESKAEEFYSLGLVLGYRYDHSPIIVDDGSALPPDEVLSYTPSARPGARLPHIWIENDVSIFDKLGSGYTLISFDKVPDAGTLVETFEKRKVPLTLINVTYDDYQTIYGTKLVLVRPDQHVAWRGDQIPENPLEVLDKIRGALG